MLKADEIQEPLRNYYRLKEIYLKWKEGLFGSRNYYDKRLRSLLADLIGKEIETENNYIIETPGGLSGSDIKCKFRNCKWLVFHGKIEIKDIENMIKEEPDIFLKWWRSGIFFAVKGVVKKFRIGRNVYGRTVELYFDRIIIINPNK